MGCLGRDCIEMLTRVQASDRIARFARCVSFKVLARKFDACLEGVESMDFASLTKYMKCPYFKRVGKRFLTRAYRLCKGSSYKQVFAQTPNQQRLAFVGLSVLMPYYHAQSTFHEDGAEEQAVKASASVFFPFLKSTVHCLMAGKPLSSLEKVAFVACIETYVRVFRTWETVDIARLLPKIKKHLAVNYLLLLCVLIRRPIYHSGIAHFENEIERLRGMLKLFLGANGLAEFDRGFPMPRLSQRFFK